MLTLLFHCLQLRRHAGRSEIPFRRERALNNRELTEDVVDQRAQMFTM